MSRPGGMEHAVEEAEAAEHPERRPVGLELAECGGQRLVESLLPHHEPAERPVTVDPEPRLLWRSAERHRRLCFGHLRHRLERGRGRRGRGGDTGAIDDDRPLRAAHCGRKIGRQRGYIRRQLAEPLLQLGRQFARRVHAERAASRSVLQRHVGQAGEVDRDVEFRVGDRHLEPALDPVWFLRLDAEGQGRTAVRVGEPAIVQGGQRQ